MENACPEVQLKKLAIRNQWVLFDRDGGRGIRVDLAVHAMLVEEEYCVVFSLWAHSQSEGACQFEERQKWRNDSQQHMIMFDLRVDDVSAFELEKKRTQTTASWPSCKNAPLWRQTNVRLSSVACTNWNKMCVYMRMLLLFFLFTPSEWCTQIQTPIYLLRLVT